jgi:putative aldouronate transport system permease protein
MKGIIYMTAQVKKVKKSHKILKTLKKEKYLWLLITPGIVFFILFHYIPMYGITIAFKDFSVAKGIMGSDWAGLVYFKQFFSSPLAGRVIGNTIILSLLTLLYGFPAPIIIALLLNECVFTRYKKVVQTISYFPNFVSVVVVVGIIVNFTNPIDGIFNELFKIFGKEPVNFMNDPKWFRPLYVSTNIWQYAGWASIIYMAALTSIDPMLYEAAIVDGANRWHSIIHITIPSILPTIIIMFIIRMGRLMSIGMEKVLLMYSPGIYETADIISTFVYRKGILGAQYSFGAAVGLFNSVINMALLLFFNYLSRKVSETSLF